MIHLLSTSSVGEQRTFSKATMVEDWQARVARKQESCRDKIPKDWLLPSSTLDQFQLPLEAKANNVIKADIPRKSKIMTEHEISITEDYTVPALLEALATSKLTALDVTLAFSKRAAIAGQLLNCVTETYFEQAQERAKQLDAMRSEGKVAGPLHGLPISVKDGFKVKGSDASIGFVSFLDLPSDTNSPLIDVLTELGAVIYVKTNIPQTLMTADSQNNVFGRTLNPHNTMLTAGGSSGGEGALVAFRGSPLGIGTDIAGSIRIPALCDGTYGFKPTTCRIPYGGQASPNPPGFSFFLACAGPLANDIDALQVLVKAVLQARPARFDATVLDVPWRDVPSQATSKLKIGLLLEDPIHPVHPPVKRALKEAAKLVSAQGHEVVELDPTECHVAYAAEVAFKYFGLNRWQPGTSPIEQGGEPLIPSVEKARKVMGKTSFRFIDDINDLEGLPLLTALNVKRAALIEDWRKLWSKYQLDAVMAPAAQHTAVPHDQYERAPYTVFLNCLDVSEGMESLLRCWLTLVDLVSRLRYPILVQFERVGSGAIRRRKRPAWTEIYA